MINYKIYNFNVLTQQKQAKSIMFNSERGYIEVLMQHENMHFIVMPGKITIQREHYIDHYACGNGFAHIDNNNFTIIVDSLEKLSS